MSPGNRVLFGHVALALSRYLKELRRDGVAPPAGLVFLAEFCTDCANQRQDATALAALVGLADADGMTRYPMLTKREAAAELRLSVRSLERLLADPTVALTAVRIDGAVRVRRADLDAYVSRLPSRGFRDQIEEKAG